MKNKTIMLLALIALAFVPVAAQAGINPGTLSLPNVQLNIVADNNHYTNAVTIPGKQASAMCVACHTRNPGAYTPYRQTRADWNYAGSHWVTSNFNDTSKGGGYTDGTSPHDRASRITAGTAFYFADNNSGNITVANGWYGLPKYGYLNGSNPDNTTSRTTGTQLICESCHNIVRNIGPAKLLASGFANGGTAASTNLQGAPGSTIPALCIGCHSDMNAGVNAEWQYHPLVSGTWGGTHHHRNNPGSPAAPYLGAGTAHAAGGMVNLTYADYNEVSGGNTYQMWAPGPGGLTYGSTRAIDYTSNPSRMRNVAATDNGQIGHPGNARLLCTNCHRAHNAESTAGATILMSGAPLGAIGTQPIPTGTSDAWRATTRMNDRGGRGAAFASTNSLCMVCHQ